jgi:hypothetical protein
MLAILWFERDVVTLTILLGLCLLYFFLSLYVALDSFQFVQKKKRLRQHLTIMITSPLKTIIQKETIVLWRERLFFSFLFSAIATGLFTGYLSLEGAELLIPEQLRETAENILPTVYVALGVYVVAVFSSVFTSLYMFLNEEKTIWILYHMPVLARTFVVGKLLSMVLPFVCCLPFIIYYCIFGGTSFLLFSFWLLCFSFLAGIILSFPLGAKYFGRKSDLLVLYCISLLLFVVVGMGISFENLIPRGSFTLLWFYICSLLVEVVLLYFSVELTTHILSSTFKRT